MRLLGQPNSINVRKVLWTCAELGYTPEIEHWGTETQPTNHPDFLEISPKGLIPVLIDGDLTLTESNTICRYLVGHAGRSDLLSLKPRQRAQIEAWMDWQATELNNSWRTAFMAIVRKDPSYAKLGAQQISIQTWNKLMALLDDELRRTGAFVCGPAFTLADIVLGLSANRWEMTPMEKPSLPGVTAWMHRMSDRSGFQTHCRNGIP